MTTDTKTLSRSRMSNFNWRRFLVVFALSLVGLFVVSGIAAFAYARMHDGKILPGVAIGGVVVADLTPDEARAKLQATLPDVSAGTLSLRVGSVQRTIAYSDIDRHYDLDQTLEDAMSVGRGGTAIDQLAAQVSTMTGGVTLVPSVTYDAQKLTQRVTNAVAAAQVTPVNATISFKNGAYVVTPAMDGQSVDAIDAMRQAIAALNTDSTDSTSVVVAAATVSADISTPDASAAIERAQAVTDAPLTIKAATQTQVINSLTLRGWVRLEESTPGQWQLMVARDPIDQMAALLKRNIDQPAVEAEFKFDNGHAVAVPGQDGYELDASAASDAIYNALTGRAAGTPASTVTLPVTATVPNLTTAQAQALVSNVKLIGSWTTHYIPSSHNNGGQNIRRPADLIDGTVVQPGAVFDFVGVAGPITEANGYGNGAAIVHGKTKGEGVLGGGLCSASTTMFNAALRAGFEIDARRNHAYYISRYPVGLDATIWINGGYTQTMSFTNDSPYPIVIRGINHRKEVTFEIYGVPDGRTVNLSDATVTGTRASTSFYEFTDTLAARVKSQIEWAADGFNSVVTRVVRDANGQIIHQDTLRSSYKKVDGIILVGRAPGDPAAGTQIPVSQGLPPINTPKPTPTPTPTGTPTPAGPTANFTWGPRDGNPEITFIDTSTGNPDNWKWDFGGANTSDQPSPTYDFVTAGKYKVTLTVSNANGSNSVTKTIKIKAIDGP